MNRGVTEKGIYTSQVLDVLVEAYRWQFRITTDCIDTEA